MKKIIFYILTFSLFVNDLKATKNLDSASMISPITSTIVDKNRNTSELLVRLKQIEQIDLTNVSKLEKATLRNEVVAINKELKNARGGIYLSVGAIIIILLLIVLL
jgi:hypothetical protein